MKPSESELQCFWSLAIPFILMEVVPELHKAVLSTIDLGFIPQLLPSYTENKPGNFLTGQVQCLCLLKICRG